MRDRWFRAEVTRTWSPAVFLILVMAVSLAFLAVYVGDFPWDDPRFGVESMLDGPAHKPFVYRVLLPSLIRVASSVYPLNPRSYAVALMYLFLVGFVLSFRYLTAAFIQHKQSSMLISLAVFAALLLLRLPYPYAHLYDFATLCLFTLALALMVRAKWPAFLVVFALNGLNKETAILLTVVFAAHFFRRVPRPVFLALSLAQLGIFAIIRVSIMWQYRGNPGSALEFNLSRHLAAMRLLPAFTIVYAVLGLLVLWAILRKWRAKPLFLRQAWVALFPVMLALYFLFGSPFEFRAFYEVLPIALLLAMPKLWGESGDERSEP